MGNKNFLLRVRVLDDDYSDGPSAIAVSFSEERMAEIKDMIFCFKGISSDRSSLVAMEFWDSSGSWIEGTISPRTEELVDDVQDEERLNISDREYSAFDGCKQTRMDVERLVIMDMGVYFTGTIKHTSVSVESEAIPFPVFLGGDNPENSALREELETLEAAFALAGGRGVELADQIDELRELLGDNS